MVKSAHDKISAGLQEALDAVLHEALPTKLVGELSEVAQRGRLVRFQMPFDPQLSMMMDLAVIEFWGAALRSLEDDAARLDVMLGSEQRIKRANKRRKRGKLTSAEMDDVAKDIAVWVAYQMHHNGRQDLVEPVAGVDGIGRKMN